MIACVRKVRLVVFRRYFKIFLKLKISKKKIRKQFFWKKKNWLKFPWKVFWKIFKKIFEKKNSKISKKNFLEIFFWNFFWNFYFQKNLKISSESYDSHLSNARNHNYYERIEQTRCSKEALLCRFLVVVLLVLVGGHQKFCHILDPDLRPELYASAASLRSEKKFTLTKLHLH